MEKDFGNIGSMHINDANKRHEKWQRENKDTPINKGEYVKVGFVTEDPEKKEHMWVEVTKVSPDGRTVIGTLANEPIVITHMNFGDEVSLLREQIEDHLLPQN